MMGSRTPAGRGIVMAEAVGLVLSNHRTKSPNTGRGVWWWWCHISTPGVDEMGRGPQLLVWPLLRMSLVGTDLGGVCLGGRRGHSHNLLPQ